MSGLQHSVIFHMPDVFIFRRVDEIDNIANHQIESQIRIYYAQFRESFE